MSADDLSQLLESVREKRGYLVPHHGKPYTQNSSGDAMLGQELSNPRDKFVRYFHESLACRLNGGFVFRDGLLFCPGLVGL